MCLAEVLLMDNFHYTQTDLPLPSINGGTSLLVYKAHPVGFLGGFLFFLLFHTLFSLFSSFYTFLFLIPHFSMKDCINKPVASIAVS